MPRIVALGGGTGLSTVLRGLKRVPCHLSAVVAMSDDGGSSGRLRRELGVLPPGDVRNCLVALADDESLLGQLFQYRFADGDLAGHPFGNLFLAALAEVSGDFDAAVRECSRVLAIRGRVLPSTLAHVRLWAERSDGEIVCGESRIGAGRGAIERVWLDPVPDAHPDVLAAIAEADLIVLGPGSLFTSICVHLAVPQIAHALTNARAPVVYVCNIMTQPGEADGFDAADHLDALERHAPGVVDAILVHDGAIPAQIAERYARQGQVPVSVDRARIAAAQVALLEGNLAGDEQLARHDPAAIADALARLIGIPSRATRR